MEHYLDYLIVFVNLIRSTNSRLLKEETLNHWWAEAEKWEKEQKIENLLLKMFHYVYDYDKQYYITSANILKKDLSEKGLFAGKKYDNLWSLLDDLSNRVITGHQAIMAVQQFLKELHNEKWEKLVLDIIDKDLKCGLSEVTINKVCGNIIKTYDCCLAQKFDAKKHTLTNSWVIERKLDGCRVQVINKNGQIKAYSRQGKEFTTLSKLVNELEGHLPDNTVLDGEICLVDENGLESFQGIMKEIKRKDHTIENPLMLCFDMLTLQEFESKEGNTKYTTRMERLKEWYNLQNWNTQNKVAKHLSIVNYEFYSPKVLEEWSKRVQKYGWEGLMFRKDVGYEGKRTNNLLKFKSFLDAEFRVEAIEEGDAQELIDGKMVKIKCVGSLIINYKGNKVGVGTGLSLAQRKRWYEHPEEIVGKTVTIKYFEETQNQDGTWSLRFPVLKYVYDEEREV
jgi:DNA ligase-1